MNGLIDSAKIRLWDIVNELARLKPTPDHGQNTEEVLRELGYDAAAIEELRGKGAV